MPRAPDARAVEVRTPGRDETEAPAHRAVRRRLARRVLGIERLDAHEPRLDQLGDQLVAVREPGVSEHRYSAGAPDEANGLDGREPFSRNVRRAVRREVPVERLANRLHVAMVDHHLRHVGAAGRAFLHDGKDLGRIDRHAELAEPRRDPVHALPSLLALGAEELLEPRGFPVQAVAENVDLGARNVAVDLETGDDLERGHATRLVHRFGETARGVVVGHGEDADAVARGQPHQLARGERAVGRGRMRVQVDRVAQR